MTKIETHKEYIKTVQKEHFLNDWHYRRALGIGGSDVSAIIGLNKYKNIIDIWEAKKYVKEDHSSYAARAGTALESLVTRIYEEETGHTVQDYDAIIDHEKPWLIGNIDGYIESESKILECKTANSYVFKRFGEPGTDQVPGEYYLQCQHYMRVSGIHKCDLAVLVDNRNFHIYHIDYDADQYSKVIMYLDMFWLKNVINNIKPECKKEYQIELKKGVEIVADEQLIGLSYRLNEANQEIKKLDQERKEVKKSISDRMGEACSLVDGKGGVLLSQYYSTSKTLDKNRLMKDHKEINFSEYEKESKFRVIKCKIKA